MSARRCSTCDVNYPDEDTHEICLGCNAETWRMGKEDTWDEDWPAKVDLLNKQARVKSGPIPSVETQLFRYKDRLWIAEQLLTNEGYLPESLGIVRINDDFYELSGYRGGEIPSWWIEKVEQEFAFAHLKVMSASEYAELELKRGLRSW